MPELDERCPFRRSASHVSVHASNYEADARTSFRLPKKKRSTSEKFVRHGA